MDFRKSRQSFHSAANTIEVAQRSVTGSSTPSCGRGGDLELSSPRFPTSRPSSARSSSFIDQIKHEVMVNHLYQQQCSRLWLSDDSGSLEGVLVRKSRTQFITCPPALAESRLAAILGVLNCQFAMTINSRVIKTFLSMALDAVDVPLTNGLRIQLLPTVEDLLKARKLQFAAFIASEGLLVVWDDEALNLVERANGIEAELMKLVWSAGDTEHEKRGLQVMTAEFDAESGEVISEKRPTHLLNSILVMFTLILIFVTLGAAIRQIVIEISVDGTWVRLCFLLLVPVQIFFTLVG
jgi:hypothetical protein